MTTDGPADWRWVTARLFLADNGEILRFRRLDAIQVMEGVAAGRISYIFPQNNGDLHAELHPHLDTGCWFL